MTHINPGTDTTINPAVIDDSYRERKQRQQCNRALCMLRDDCPGVGWIPPCATLAHSPEAQQRVKQIDKKICQLGDMIHEIQYAGKVSAEVINDLDSVLEVYSEVREAIALLQAGDHHE